MWPDLAFINSATLVLVGVVLSFLVTRYWNNRKLVETARQEVVTANSARDSRIVELEKQLAMVTAAVVPISTAFQAILIKELTHSDAPELDRLLEKLGPPIDLTAAEERRMHDLLKEREEEPGIPDSERDAARMLPLVIKRVKQDMASPNPSEAVQLVGLPPDATKAEE
jgi:hypothetical protein